MASRISTSVTKGQGARLYHNDSTKAQLVTIHGISNSTTLNPAVTLILNTNASASLNFETQVYTLSSVAGTITNIDPRFLGTQAWRINQAGPSYLQDLAGSNYASQSQYRRRFQIIDPWMLVKPSEYGNKSDSVCALVGSSPSTGHAAAWNDIFPLIDGGANIKDFLTENNSSYNQHLSISYYTRGMCYDQHTLSMVGVDNSAYMSSSCYRMGNNNNWLGVQNRTSDSVSYSWGVGPADPGSYPVSNSFANSWSPAMMADGGIFIFNQHRYNNASHRTMILPAGRAYYGGTLPSDHTQTDGTVVTNSGNIQPSDMTYANGNRTAYISATDGDEFQWMKWNKANDKYYLCWRSGSNNTTRSGIFEMEYATCIEGSNSDAGLTGHGGSNGVRQDQYAGFTKVADYPVSESTRMTIPQKVGDSLWLSYTDAGVGYYSQDLKTWTAASSFIEGGYVIQAQNRSNVNYFVKSDNSVVTLSAGINEMDQSGLLEKQTPIGNYTRNGLVLNPGDCLYCENHDATATVSFTVTEVAI